jgi:hypothetical protein
VPVLVGVVLLPMRMMMMMGRVTMDLLLRTGTLMPPMRMTRLVVPLLVAMTVRRLPVPRRTAQM